MRTKVLLAAVLGLSVIGASAALAGGTASPSTIFGSQITRVIAVRDTEAQTTQANPWVDLAGATAALKVPAGNNAMVLVDFSAESLCEVSAPDVCTVRIMVNGIEAEPAAGTDFAFDSSHVESDARQARSMSRSLGPLGPGIYVVQVQWGAGGINLGTFTLDDWSLVVEKVAP
jgi:hypothetical protein